MYFRVLSSPPNHDKTCIVEVKPVTVYRIIDGHKPEWVERSSLLGATMIAREEEE